MVVLGPLEAELGNPQRGRVLLRRALQLGPLRADEPLHLAAGSLVGLGRLDAQTVHAPVDVRVAVSVVSGDRVDHRVGLLRGGGVVEVRERLAVDGTLQDREIGADFLQVVGGGGVFARRVPGRDFEGGRVPGHAALHSSDRKHAAGSQWVTWSVNAWRTSSD